ncbi:MAG: 2-hydroxyacyl-CoA dehydratase [Clostridia bacterium]|nr:2-hydroxyacyl-CoA dehydratase [Clostridia bacterium]
MADVIETFGRYVQKQIPKRPNYAGGLLLTAYRAYGFALKTFPEKRLTDAKQYLAAECMDCIVRPLAHPGDQVLTSMFMPCEAFFAAGLLPMCAEQYSTYANGAGAEHAFIEAAENAGIAETFCSYHKTVTGAAISGVLPKPAAIVNTSLACDANNLTFRKAAELTGAPQFYIDVPYMPCEDAVDYVADQLRDMTRRLYDVTGRKTDEAMLRSLVQNSRKTMAIMRDIIGLKRDRYVPTDLTSELYEALLWHNAMGLPKALKYAEKLRADLLKSREKPGRKILWMHTNPFYQKTVQDIFNWKRDPWIALTELSYDNLVEMDEKDPYRAMAARAVYNYYNGPVSRRAERAAEVAYETGADGVILFCHWGCKETCGASTVIEKTVSDAGLPVLVLNGDGVDRRNSSDGQMKTRIGAFLEMLEGRR